MPYYIEPDHLGMPRSMVDPTRNVAVWSWPLLDNPFGELGAISDLDGDGVGIGQPLRFSGQFLDNETGLYQNGYRYFDPGTGRYAESDPIGLQGGITTYVYVNSSPYKYTDRFGLACDHPACYERGGYGQIKMGETTPEQEANISLAMDFVPIIGDLKGAYGAYQDPTAINIAAACIGLVPGAGDAAAKILKNFDNVKSLVSRISSQQTTILGENMRDRVIPFANNTGARTLPWGTTPERWAQMTPQQRWRLNDGLLRSRINEGDSFRYIGIDPGRSPGERQRFDLTGSELLRLNDRNINYQQVPANEIFSTIGRP